MDTDLIPTLADYYRATQCTKEIGYKIDIRKHVKINQKLEAKLEKSNQIQDDLRTQIEELKLELSKTHTTSEVRQREIESLRSRHQDSDKADKALTGSLKIQADSYKREIREVREDLKLREEELKDLREDVSERDKDIKEARELTRTRDREIKEVRDALRLRDSESRKLNHTIEKLQARIDRLEGDVQEAQDALDAAKDARIELEVRKEPVVRKPKPIARAPSPALPVPSPPSSRPEPLTDYTLPPTKQHNAIPKPTEKARPKPRASNKENVNVQVKKRKVAEFTVSPPRSSPPPESPKRKKTTKSDFSMTPFIDKTKKTALGLIPLSPPSSRVDDLKVPVNDGKKKRKLLGGIKTLMDDTPKRPTSKAVKNNFGKELSPLKRPKSSAGLILN